MKDDKFSLTEEQIRKLADGSSFGRGIDYYESGHICNPVCQGLSITHKSLSGIDGYQ